MSVLLALFWICFGLFVGDVIVGRIGVSTVGVGPILSDVGDFLMLALAAAFLTAECLRREASVKRAKRELEEDPTVLT